MKILLVIDTYDTNNNGTSISAQRFAAVLREHGNEVRILTTGEPAPDKFVLKEFKVTSMRRSPKTLYIAFASLVSPTCVEVA